MAYTVSTDPSVPCSVILVACISTNASIVRADRLLWSLSSFSPQETPRDTGSEDVKRELIDLRIVAV
jgi:hypothetical protein